MPTGWPRDRKTAGVKGVFLGLTAGSENVSLRPGHKASHDPAIGGYYGGNGVRTERYLVTHGDIDWQKPGGFRAQQPSNRVYRAGDGYLNINDQTGSATW